MDKKDIARFKNDTKSLNRSLRVIRELIQNFPYGVEEIQHQEEFLQLQNTRICLTKTIYRLKKLLEKSSI